MEQDKTIRLNKYLAECGVCSRREADRHIEAGSVTVDGMVARVGCQVNGASQIEVNGKKIKGLDEKVVLAFYKPEGVTCTEKDEHAKITITEYIKYPIRITYAGRLDQESSGLMIMSNDGELIQKITRSVNGHEKEYQVKVNKKVTQNS